jgi:zinc transport system substrate-binding protein
MLNRIYFFFAILAGMITCAHAEVPNVVVTLKPVHSLVMSILGDLKAPIVLYKGAGSPHVQMPTPQELRQIDAADVVIWVGPSYETPLQGIKKSIKPNQRLVTLTEEPGIILYPVRQGGMWGHLHLHNGSLCDSTDHTCESEGDAMVDGHIWLDPQNAIRIVRVIVEVLVNLDPSHEQIYRSNAAKVINRLDDLDDELQQQLILVQNKPYLVYHDGTQYFDRHFKTKAVGVLIGDNHYGINAKHLLQIPDYIRDQKVKCVFTEPQFSTDMLKAIFEKTGTKIETLDYLGIGLEANEDAYFIMMRNLAQAFIRGLSGENNP